MDLEQAAVRSLEDLAEEFADLPLDVVARVVGDNVDALERGALTLVRRELNRVREERRSRN